MPRQWGRQIHTMPWAPPLGGAKRHSNKYEVGRRQIHARHRAQVSLRTPLCRLDLTIFDYFSLKTYSNRRDVRWFSIGFTCQNHYCIWNYQFELLLYVSRQIAKHRMLEIMVAYQAAARRVLGALDSTAWYYLKNRYGVNSLPPMPTKKL